MIYLKEPGKVLFTARKIQTRVKEIAEQISHDYAGREILVVGILRGAFVFTSDLIRNLKVPVCVDFMAISSYGQSSDSSGVVKMLKDLEENIESRHVLIVEDIVDTGLTLQYLMRTLSARHPATLKVCTLLDRASRRKVKIDLHYVGFTIPDYFVVGYGLDFAQKYRNLPYIATLTET
ncbi:MAG: hypoxanthine phosphoribosyltransferase [bacterium JZ-2024 1]